MRIACFRGGCAAPGVVAIALLAAGVETTTAQESKPAEAPAGRTVDAGGLTFQVPESWKQIAPSSAMRRAELRIPPAEGDKTAGELAVFVFPQGAGTVEANVERWQQQFQEAGGKTPAVESRKVPGKNIEVTRVEVAGTYVQPPFSGGGSFPNYRLLGAIAETPRGAYFLKLVGPDKTLLAAEPAFDAMIASMTATSE